MLDLTYEKELWSQGTEYIIGIDEVGRGPIAGPVVVGAVVFDKTHQPIAGINDSKQIAKHKLATLSEQIQSSSLGFSIGIGSVEMINERGIVYALQYTISESINNLELKINNKNMKLVIDGLPYKDTSQFSGICSQLHLDNKTIYQPKADGSIYSVAAASIIAKVYRDELMTQLAEQHPQYLWEQNAGYGTKKHREAVNKYGMTTHHRELFCRKTVNF